jgi:protein-S-isoprenylcysteine O-methyltransferase Ste14
MTAETATRILVPLLFLAFAFADLVWPLLRLRRTVGTWGIPIFAERDPRRRAVGFAIALILIALAVGVARFAWGGAPAAGAAVPPAPVAALGIALLALAVAVVAVAQRQMGGSLRVGIPQEDTALVSRGLFAWVRNPIFVGMIAGMLGVALAVPAPWSAAVCLGGIAAIAYQVRLEEEHLLLRHGDAYRAYASRVGRFLPGVGRL